MAPPSLTNGWRRTSSTMSFAVTFAAGVPVISILTVSGTSTRTSRVTHELAIAVDPTPNAKVASAPECGVWESLPTITWPGNA